MRPYLKKLPSLYVAAFAFLTAMIILAASCNTVKRTVDIKGYGSIVRTDTISNNDTTAIKDLKSDFHFFQEKDTAIGVAGGEIIMALDGRTLTDDVDTVISKGNMSLQVYSSKSGIKVRCKSDSLTLVIKNLKKDSVYQARRYDSFAHAMLYRHTSVTDSTSTLKEIVDKERKGFFACLFRSWIFWLVVVAGSCILLRKTVFA